MVGSFDDGSIPSPRLYMLPRFGRFEKQVVQPNCIGYVQAVKHPRRVNITYEKVQYMVGRLPFRVTQWLTRGASPQ